MKKKQLSILVISVITSLIVTACTNDLSHEDMGHSNHQEETKMDKANTAKGKELFESVPTEFNQYAEQGIQTLNTKNVTRLNSNDPIQTAVLASQTIFPATHKENQPGTVILVPVENWQIGLASADLIHHPNNGPILFYTKDGIPMDTLNEIKRLNPIGNAEGVQIMVMGDVSKDMVKSLQPFQVENIKGSAPAALAAKVDEKYASVSGGEYTNGVIIVSLDEAAQLYSLSAVNWIAHMPEPILFVSKDEVPEATIKSLQKRKNASLYILGPESIISKSVEDQLNDYGKVTRISGDDPVQTSIEFAQFKDKKTSFGWGINEPGHGVSFVSTQTPALAIAAAPFSHLGKHAPLVWLENGKITDSMYQFLAKIKPTFKDDPTTGPYNHGFVIGTQKEISFKEQGILDDKLEIVQEDGEGHSGH